MKSAPSFSRRRVLKGVFQGAAVSVGLPFLDCFLNDNGTALANGQALPSCFGSWFEGLGFNPGFWEPKQLGANYELPEQLQPLARFQKRLNIYSGLNILADGRSVSPHFTGPKACLMGLVPMPSEPLPASVDSLIADVIGNTTRYKSIEVSCWGGPESYSRRAGAVNNNPSEVSPVKLYMRIFGPEFKDPNSAEFTPDPRVILHRSVLSALMDERQAYLRRVGAADRIRLDEYFTSLRQLEQQLEIQLQKPAPMQACSMPTKEEEPKQGALIDDVMVNNVLFSKLLAHALACGQTRVFNLIMSSAVSTLRRAGSSMQFHAYTHEEAVDPQTGNQPNVKWFQDRGVEALAATLEIFDSVKEGDHTLLDRTLILYSTDTGYARLHSNENVPLMTIGNGGGRMKTGIHVAAKGDPVTRVGLTVQQAMGVPTSRWGQNSLGTSKTFSEVLS